MSAPNDKRCQNDIITTPGGLFLFRRHATSALQGRLAFYLIFLMIMEVAIREMAPPTIMIKVCQP